MGWREVRAKSRDIVHATFAHPALYFAPLSAVGVPCLVRLHNKLEVFGDLDREGFAKRFEEVNQAVFDTTVIDPAKGGVVDFGVDGLYLPIPGSDEKYKILNTPERSDNRYQVCELMKVIP